MSERTTLQNELSRIRAEAAERHSLIEFDYHQQKATDFRDLTAQVADAYRKGGRMGMEKFLNTAIGLSDFGETHDLPLDEENGFWDRVVDRSTLLQKVATQFTARKAIARNELTLGANAQDVWRPGVEGTDPGDTATADTAEVIFTPQEVIAILNITDSALEDNIEGAGLEQHMLSLIERATANQWEKAAMNGNLVGSSNSDRSSITACFDGIARQYQDAGNVVYSTAYSDRYMSAVMENNKLFAAVKSLSAAGYSLDGKVWMMPQSLVADMGEIYADRQTLLGDRLTEGGFRAGVQFQGLPAFACEAFRSDHLVKGTGTVQGSSPVDTDVAAIAKSRQAVVTVSSATNEATLNKYVIDCDAAGTAFSLHAEKCTQSGAAAGAAITMAANLTRDHAIGEIFTEYSTFPDADGIAALLAAFENLRLISHRVLRIEPYRLPRLRTTAFVLTARWCPAVLDPLDGVLIRDLLAR